MGDRGGGGAGTLCFNGEPLYTETHRESGRVVYVHAFFSSREQQHQQKGKWQVLSEGRQYSLKWRLLWRSSAGLCRVCESRGVAEEVVSIDSRQAWSRPSPDDQRAALEDIEPSG